MEMKMRMKMWMKTRSKTRPGELTEVRAPAFIYLTNLGPVDRKVLVVKA